jgi:hypothetical protein
MSQLKHTQLLVAAALAVGSTSVLAVEFSIEGKISAILPAGAAPDNVESVVCNGSAIKLKPAGAGTTVYSTPSSTNVGKAAFFSTTPFPGISSSGLLGGTCIIDGNSVGTGAQLAFVADKFFGEPAENVLVGPVTSTGPNNRFAIMGVPVYLLTKNTAHQDAANASDPNTGEADPEGRITASPPINQFGYPVVLSTVPVDDLSSAEGYLSTDGKRFYAFAVETTGGSSPVVVIPPGENPVPLAPTVQRGTLTFLNTTSSKMEIRGGCAIGTAATGATGTSPNRTQPIQLMVDSTPPVTGTAAPVTTWFIPNNVSQFEASSVTTAPAWPNVTVNASCAEDAATPGSGTYRYRLDNYSYPANPAAGTLRRVAPVNVRVALPGQKYSMPSVLERIKFP